MKHAPLARSTTPALRRILPALLLVLSAATGPAGPARAQDCNSDGQPDATQTPVVIFGNNTFDLGPFTERYEFLGAYAPLAQDVHFPSAAVLRGFEVPAGFVGFASSASLIVTFYQNNASNSQPPAPGGLIASFQSSPSFFPFDYTQTINPPIVLSNPHIWMEVEFIGGAPSPDFWGASERLGAPTRGTGRSGGLLYDRDNATFLPGPIYLDLALTGVQCAVDCNSNGRSDRCDISCTAPGCNVPGCGTSQDCDSNGVPDECDRVLFDCNSNGTYDTCEIINCPFGNVDCRDCNSNGLPDACDIDAGAGDCDSNGVPDECDPDCNSNGVADACDIAGGTSIDCNTNGVPDFCEIPQGPPSFGPCIFNCDFDCNANGIPDSCDAATVGDCQSNGIPDDDCPELDYVRVYDPDEPFNAGVPAGSSISEFWNQAPYDPRVILTRQELGQGTAVLSQNSTLAGSWVFARTPQDLSWSNVAKLQADFTGRQPTRVAIDVFPVAIGNRGRIEVYNIAGTFLGSAETPQGQPAGTRIRVFASAPSGQTIARVIAGAPSGGGGVLLDNLAAYRPSEDCQDGGAGNGTPDECDILQGASDNNQNGIPDQCEADCNENSIGDALDIAGGTSLDCNGNDFPDECEIDEGSPAPGGPFFCQADCDPDCNDNGVPDACDIAGATSDDCNNNTVPDECLIVDSRESFGTAGTPVGPYNPPAGITLQATQDDVPIPGTQVFTADLDFNPVNGTFPVFGFGYAGFPLPNNSLWSGVRDLRVNFAAPGQQNPFGLVGSVQVEFFAPAAGAVARLQGFDSAGTPVGPAAVSDPLNPNDVAILRVNRPGEIAYVEAGGDPALLDLCDPDDTAVGQTITGCANVTVEALVTTTADPLLAVENPSNPGVGDMLFGHASGLGGVTEQYLFGREENLKPYLRARFTNPVSTVSIDMLALAAGTHQGRLRAYDATGNLIRTVTTQQLSQGQRERITIGSPAKNISRVRADGNTNTSFVGLENLFASDSAIAIRKFTYFFENEDCDFNTIPDDCDLASGGSDCNHNALLDVCEVEPSAGCPEGGCLADCSADCNENCVPDECEIDCNGNGVPDDCDIAAGTAMDANSNGIPDSCEIDCNFNGVPDNEDIDFGTSDDCNSNGVPDECLAVDVLQGCEPDNLPIGPPVGNACGGATIKQADGNGAVVSDAFVDVGPTGSQGQILASTGQRVFVRLGGLKTWPQNNLLRADFKATHFGANGRMGRVSIDVVPPLGGGQGFLSARNAQGVELDRVGSGFMPDGTPPRTLIVESPPGQANQIAYVLAGGESGFSVVLDNLQYFDSNTDCDSSGVNDDCEINDDPALDTDSDGVLNVCDNCPQNPNPFQENLDGDDLGNVCDPDADGDGFQGTAAGGNGQDCDDLNPDVNPARNERFADGTCGDNFDNNCNGLFDAFDSNCDTDSDGIADGFDNCPRVRIGLPTGSSNNIDQGDVDGDGTRVELCTPPAGASACPGTALTTTAGGAISTSGATFFTHGANDPNFTTSLGLKVVFSAFDHDSDGRVNETLGRQRFASIRVTGVSPGDDRAVITAFNATGVVIASETSDLIAPGTSQVIRVQTPDFRNNQIARVEVKAVGDAGTRIRLNELRYGEGFSLFNNNDPRTGGNKCDRDADDDDWDGDGTGGAQISGTGTCEQSGGACDCASPDTSCGFNDFCLCECDDLNPNINPDATELCDGIDNNCSGRDGTSLVDQERTPLAPNPGDPLVGDGIASDCDNCPSFEFNHWNPDQIDCDAAFETGCDPAAANCGGDSCDNFDNEFNATPNDADSDGIWDRCDNCPNSPNGPLRGTPPADDLVHFTQIDSDGDGYGDACDLCPGQDDDQDSDEDGIRDCQDNCPFVFNPGNPQADADGDLLGDVCDNCPGRRNGPTLGSCFAGKVGQNCTSNTQCNSAAGVIDGLCSLNQADADTDGVLGGSGDNTTGGDVCDCDADGDSFTTDNATRISLLTCTGTQDDCDDLNRFVNPGEVESELVGNCADGIDNDCDGTIDCDSDSDGVPNADDNCPDDPNPNQDDADSDGFGDACDGCALDPFKTEPGACGCGVADTDSDSDGTPNCNDGCPNDPNKIAPGVCGCGVSDADADSDGTPNCVDGCPNDPNKIAPGVCGCGVSDADADSDGTPNCNDGCPNDPNKIAPGVCGCGVPDVDSDSDGVLNCNDGCPNDPGKTAPGVCGCGIPDTDADSDGTPNCNDGCPNDPNKVAPGTCGCGVADTDSDGDQTPDCNDQCPNDANKIVPGICGCGVADTDSDSDGTADCNDQCPNDPAKTAPGQCGCGNPETDTDSDGTADCVDTCTDTDSDGFGNPGFAANTCSEDNCPDVSNPLQIDCDGDGVGDRCDDDPDGDSDGVADSCDNCPFDANPDQFDCDEDTPDSGAPGFPDCQAAPDCGGDACDTDNLDTDGDGVGAPCDECPNDGAKTVPGVCGCGVPDVDSDSDGVLDCQDGCPGDPNKTDPGQCGCGNPETDSDSDGTADCVDECPDDPNKSEPGICGCNVSDEDTDGDQTADCLDGCPDDPDKIDPGVCGCNIADTDSDGDETPDCLDGCPGDPNKIAPGICGCGNADTDTDSDGVADCNDGCPNNPNKVAPGQCGCSVPDTDSDSDGVADCIDLCPNDPAKVVPGVCGCGTPETDSDGDGAPNCVDGCPNDGNKTAPGTCGCGVPDTDSDGDGVANCNDACPTDANKSVSGGLCGCGVADTDADGDGFPSCNGTVDACDNNPDKTQPGICGCNLADQDKDGDLAVFCATGNPNNQDQCDNDPNKVVPGICGCGVSDGDSDSDGPRDCNDNCPFASNGSQIDTDFDGVGNVCDNCPLAFNPSQKDADGDAVGDACDNCPNNPNGPAQAGTPNVGNQIDSDGDGLGDVCDPDGAPQPIVDNDGGTGGQDGDTGSICGFGIGMASMLSFAGLVALKLSWRRRKLIRVR